jgi:hypothetical protein
MSKKLIAALAIGLSASSAVFAGAIVPLDNTLNTLPRTNFYHYGDGHGIGPSGDVNVVSGPVDLGFKIDFLGTDYSQLYVSNNGNVTFDAPHGGYRWPEGAVIAPYFSDVYTYSVGSVTYGNTTFDGHLAFGVNWIDLPYVIKYDGDRAYSNYLEMESRNSFQLLIVDRSDISAGDFDFIFNYDKIEWGAQGWKEVRVVDTRAMMEVSLTWKLGAFVGYGSEGNLYGFPTQTTPGALLTLTDISQLPHQSLNSDVAGRFIFEVRDGVVSPGLPPFVPAPSPVPVPEPETWGMMLLGLGLLRVVARRRRVAGKQ